MTESWKQGDPIYSKLSVKPPIQGVQFHGIWGDHTTTVRDRLLNEIVAAGVQWVRLDISWAMLQPKDANSYDMAWGVPLIDKRIAEIRAKGLKVLLLMYWAPKWAWDTSIPATNDKNGVPRNPDEYANAAAFAASRWQPDAFEVWNEPDLPEFLANTSPKTHADLLKAAYPKIKTASPRTKVIAGGTSGIKSKIWWKNVYAYGAKGSFDAIGVHGYQGVADSAPAYYDPNWVQYYLADIGNLVLLMQSNGDGAKKIWVTEYGWSSHTNEMYASPTPNWKRGVTEANQAKFLHGASQYVAKWPQVEAMFWYNEWNKNTGDAHEDNFGLLKRDFTRKPVWSAMRCVAGGVCGP